MCAVVILMDKFVFPLHISCAPFFFFFQLCEIVWKLLLVDNDDMRTRRRGFRVVFAECGVEKEENSVPTARGKKGTGSEYDQMN